jgi:hypothetical protein
MVAARVDSTVPKAIAAPAAKPTVMLAVGPPTTCATAPTSTTSPISAAEVRSIPGAGRLHHPELATLAPYDRRSAPGTPVVKAGSPRR